MVHRTVHCAYLQRRNETWHLRVKIPPAVRDSCPNAPREVRRTLRTDSRKHATQLLYATLPAIQQLTRARSAPEFEQACSAIAEAIGWETQQRGPTLTKVWKDFSAWKAWPDKRHKNNTRLFENLLEFIGDKPVLAVSKKDLKLALSGIAELPVRNKLPYKGRTLRELRAMQIPAPDRVSSKYVKEHLKLCQSLFSRYLVQEVDILKVAPTQGLRLDYEDQRFASLTDTEVRAALDRSKHKPEWFQWFLKLAVYSGARRSEIAGLRGQDFKLCPDTGRYYFLINEGKTKAAKRNVPIHQQLIGDGVLDWIGADRKALLFPTAHQNPNRVTDLFASLLDRKRNDVGERVVFHSVRHAFITKARAAGVETVLVQQVVGHEKSGAGVTDRYTHSFQLQELLPVVDAVVF